MASKLPQKKGANLSFGEHCSTCGSWLACDASDAVFELNRVDAIAGKPAPTIKRLTRSALTTVLTTATMTATTAPATATAAWRHKHPAA